MIRSMGLAVVVWFLVGSIPNTCAAQAEQPPLDPEQFDDARALYQKQCAVCHGPTGLGDGPAAYLTYPKPRDFSQDEYRLISNDEMFATDQDLFTTLTRGMPGSSMPSWESLSDEQRWGLVAYIRYLQGTQTALREGELTPVQLEAGLPWEETKAFSNAFADVESMKLPKEPSATAKGIARGKEIYAQACAACHGPSGKGDTQQVMEDSLGYPTRPRDLTAGLFKGSSSSKDLYYRIVAGLPGSPMPSYAGVYSDEQVWDLVHFVQSLAPQGIEEKVRLVSKPLHAARVSEKLSSDPTAEVWVQVTPTFIAVTPLWWRDERVIGVDLQVAHDGEQLAVRLSWEDPTVDQSLAKTESFSDGIAVQFSEEKDPPFFGMGDPHAEVDIWHWKAAWQKDRTGREDVDTVYPGMAVEYYQEKGPTFLTGQGSGNPVSDPKRTTSAESLHAKGQGTLTNRPQADQQVQGSAKREGNRWSVVLIRKLKAEEGSRLEFQPGRPVSLALAVWDGGVQDRDGQKSFSIWHPLELD